MPADSTFATRLKDRGSRSVVMANGENCVANIISRQKVEARGEVGIAIAAVVGKGIRQQLTGAGLFELRDSVAGFHDDEFAASVPAIGLPSADLLQPKLDQMTQCRRLQAIDS